MEEHDLNNTTPRISDERIIELALTDPRCSEVFVTLLLFTAQKAMESNSSNQFNGISMAAREAFKKQLRYAIEDKASQGIETSKTDGTITICKELPKNAAQKLHNIRIAKDKYGKSLLELIKESEQTSNKLTILYDVCQNTNTSIAQNLLLLQTNYEDPSIRSINTNNLSLQSLKSIKNQMKKNQSPINMNIFDELHNNIIRRDALKNEYKAYAKQAKQQSKEISKVESFLERQPNSNLEKLDMVLKNMFALAKMPCQPPEKGPTHEIHDLLQSNLISPADKKDLDKLMDTISIRDQKLSQSQQTKDKEESPKILDLPSLYQQLDDTKQDIAKLKEQKKEIQLQIDTHSNKLENPKSKTKNVKAIFRQHILRKKPKTAETDLATAEKQGKEIDDSLTSSTQKKQHIEKMIADIIQEIVVRKKPTKTMTQQIGNMFSNLYSFIKSCFIQPDYEQLNNETQQESAIQDNVHPTTSNSLSHEEEQMEQTEATADRTIEKEDEDGDGKKTTEELGPQ